jgi:solute carrier family 25 uncoupling protein 8/9
MANKNNFAPSMGERMLSAGTAACVADIMTFPFDVAKVRLQVLGEAPAILVSGSTISLEAAAAPQFKGLFGTMVYLIRNEGVKSLYGGIGPGLQRQCVFASLRIGIYDNIKDFYTHALSLDQNKYFSLMAARILSGITSGAMAIAVAQPTDVVKIKMQARSGPRYNSSIDAYKTIYRREGVHGLWRGLGPNVVRNSLVNATELVCYDTIKDGLMKNLNFGDNLLCHFTSAFGAGFCATVVASPIDVIKTRIMNSTPGMYNGMIDAVQKLYVENEGKLGAFYKGFTPSFMRLGTWNVVMFVTYEQLKKLASHVKSRQEIECLPGTLKAVVTANNRM